VGTAIAGLGPQCTIDHLSDFVVLIGTRATGSKFIVESIDAELSIPLSPLPDSHPCYAHPLGNGGVGFTGATSKHDLCSSATSEVVPSI
jgi:hypothetical protein